MRLLVLGGLGMLGHRFWIESSARHETWVTIRGRAADVPRFPAVDRLRILEGIDVLDDDRLGQAFQRARPEVVVNCVGLVKQRETASDPRLAIALNSLLPHRLAAMCASSGSRLVHISTDCVFSGDRGAYTEDSRPDPDDLYGRSKLL